MIQNFDNFLNENQEDNFQRSTKWAGFEGLYKYANNIISIDRNKMTNFIDEVKDAAIKEHLDFQRYSDGDVLLDENFILFDMDFEIYYEATPGEIDWSENNKGRSRAEYNYPSASKKDGEKRIHDFLEKYKTRVHKIEESKIIGPEGAKLPRLRINAVFKMESSIAALLNADMQINRGRIAGKKFGM